jgi:hypothetical protein
MKTKEVTVYLDGVDWQHEIGEASGGNRVYGSVRDLKENNRCWESCGVVKCNITLVEWVEEQNFNKMFRDSSKTYSVEELKTNADAVRVESSKKRLEWLEKQVSSEKNRIKKLEEKLKGNS